MCVAWFLPGRTVRPKPNVRPNDGGVSMPFKESLYLTEVGRFSPLLCKRNVDMVVDQDDQANLRGEVEQPIESWILKASDLAGIFADTNSL